MQKHTKRGRKKPPTQWRRQPYDPRSTFVARKHQYIVTGHSLATTDRMVDRGEFPKPIQLSPGRVAWLRTDLEKHVADRKAASLAAGSEPTTADGFEPAVRP